MAKGIKNVFIESDSVGVLGTKIYRDGVLIATVPVGTAFYEDPTAIEGVEYKYVNQAYTSTSESTDEVEGVNMDYYTIQAETTLTPILTNFRVEDATPNRVYFDTPLGPVTGMTTTGFVISGNNITGVDTTNNYFTVDSAFNYFDNNTIRLGENDSTGDVNATIHNFTLEYIENNITEPVSTGNKYVTATASGGNGSEGSPWTLQESFDQAVGGETVWVKAGDYGTFQDNITSRNGTASAPIKWIGYENTIGDITTNYWDYGVTMVNTKMPTFTGTADYNIRFNNSSYLILRNFQFRGGQTSIERSGDADYIEMDRFNINQMYGGIVLFQDTANSQLKNIRAINSIVNCYGLQNIIIRGAEANMIKDCKAYVDGTNGPVDYSMTIGGQNSMVISSYVENFLSDQGSLHGISIRDAYRIDSSYCLVQDCESVNYQECYAFRNIGASYNVVKNSLARNNGAAYTNDRYGVVYDGSGAYNITENVNISECDRGVVFSDDSTESSSVKVGDHSIIRNCIIDDCIIAITFAGASSDLSTNEGISFYHNTFKDCDYLTFQHSYFLNLNGGVDMVNNIIDSVPVGFSTSGDYAQPTPSDFTFINNDFFNTSTWGNTYIGSDGNIGEDPDLDSSFVPQADFSLISKARVDGVYYDMDGVTRADPTTLGSKLSPSEEAGEQPPVEDYDYYVSNTGDDNANGQTPETAWQTVNKVNNFTFASGDTIGFKSGNTWLERLTVPASNLTIDKYGTLDDPIIEQVYIVDKDFVTVNNIHSTNTASSATAISVLGSNNIHLYRCTVRPNAAATDKVGILVRAAAPYDVPYHDVIIEECDIREFHSATGWSTGVAFNEYGEDCQFINNTMYNNGEENVIVYVDHAYSSGWHDNYLISGNTIWNLDPTDDGATSFECGINFGWNCRNFTVENNYVYNVPRGIQFDSGTEDCIVKNNIIYNCKRGIHVLANDNGNATGSKIYNNTIHGTLISQEGIQLATGGSDDSPTITGFDIKNNIIIGGGGAELFIIKGVKNFPATQVISFTSDNNMYYNNGDALRFYIQGDPIYDLSGWQTAYSLDLNSTEQDPLLNIDSTLQSGSPALDAGATLVDVPLDYIGTSRPQGPAYSIGVYEEAYTAYGQELTTNGNFDTDSDWTLEAGFTISGGKMNVVSGGNGYQGVNVDDSKTYRLTVTSDGAEGNIIVYADGMYWSELYYDGVNEFTLTIETVGGSQTNQLRFGCTTNGTLDNVSLKEII